ncbi:MAG: hypothetical protein IKJ45_03750 [Kiritimatiellae bacterium]|nr:hypothetical protein [Kiritimatiellia bacterium]
MNSWKSIADVAMKVCRRAIVSAAIASVCGLNASTADRYEARHDALRLIARERNLASNDVAALFLDFHRGFGYH